MGRWAGVLLVGVLLVAGCGGPAAPKPETVVEAIDAAGVPLLDVREEALPEEAPVPRSFTSRRVFAISEVAPAGGQLFVCDTARNCEAIYEYFDALAGLAGPYTYLSGSGLVVVQLNSGLSPTTAEKVAGAIRPL